MKTDFKTLYTNLQKTEYQAHWFTRHTHGKLDCSDIAYKLSKWCRDNQIPYHFILTIFPRLDGLHIAIVIDGMVYDPLWEQYETPITDYKTILNGLISIEAPQWVEKIIP